MYSACALLPPNKAGFLFIKVLTMSRLPNAICERNRAIGETVEPYTIRCYLYSTVCPRNWPKVMSRERLLGAQALLLLTRLDAELRDARADWNHDRFRRLMHVRSNAVNRLLRRWSQINPTPRVPLGSLRRRYHSSLAGHLYTANE